MISRDLKIFLNIPELKTARLLLRRIRKSDLFDVFEYSNDELVPKYLLWYPHPDIDYTKKYLSNLNAKYKRGEIYDWGIEYEGKIIGTVGFTSFDIRNNTGEIGYVLSSKFWGKGIGLEAAGKILEFGFENLSLNRIEVRYMPENIQSRRLSQKLGMKYEGVKRQAVFCKGEYRDVAIAAILKEDYKKINSKMS